MSGVKLSKKHGLNPSIAVCVACYAEWGVILAGALPDDAEAPTRVAADFCAACGAVISAGGVMLIEVEDGTEAAPVRTGRTWGITGEEFTRIFTGVERGAPCAYIERAAAITLFGAPSEGEKSC